MAFGEMFSSLRTYAALDRWTATLGESVAGMAKVGYKANRTTFSTITTARNDLGATTATGLSFKLAEQNLNAATYIDWSQGELVVSEGRNHFAIDGEGFFLVMDDQGKFYVTRGGQFEYKNGRVQTTEGLTVVDKALLQSLGTDILPSMVSDTVGDVLRNTPYAPTLTAAELNNEVTSWVKASDVGTTGGNFWLPYVGGTKFDEGNNTYTMQAITAKRSFILDGPATAADLSVFVDDWAWVYVNGQLLTANDVMNATPAQNQDFGGTPIFNGTTQFNIAPYLRQGVNTIQIYAVENAGTNTLSTTGSITTISGTVMNIENYYTPGDTRWSTKLVGVSPASQDPDAPAWYGALLEPPPGEAQEDRMFNLNPQDFVIARIANLDGLRYSKYGNTIYELTDATGLITLWHPENNGMGRVRGGMLEASNVNADNLPAEMKMAQVMFEGIASMFEMRYWMIDLMFQRLVP